MTKNTQLHNQLFKYQIINWRIAIYIIKCLFITVPETISIYCTDMFDAQACTSLTD